jgi:signal peptidase II
MGDRMIVLSLAIIALIILVDQATKLWFVANFAMFESREIIPNVFYWTRKFNTGASWGILEGQLGLFIVITILAIGFFIYLLRDAMQKNQPWHVVGLSLMMGGTIGNFIDRLRLGGVVDFIDVYIFGYDFPVFNVADSALNVGLVVFFIGVFFFEHTSRQNPEPN